MSWPTELIELIKLSKLIELFMIAIIDYGMGNLRSVEKALEALGASASILSSPGPLEDYSAVILPGVGAFGDAMRNLTEQKWDKSIRKAAEGGKPLLGICLGLQLLFTRSEEGGSHRGLGLLPGQVVKLPSTVRVPHMGWNRIRFPKTSALFRGVSEGAYVYFVHSYYVAPEDPAAVAAVTDYGVEFASAVSRENIYGLQFHPEKSQAVGLKILENFLKIIGNS